MTFLRPASRQLICMPTARLLNKLNNVNNLMLGKAQIVVKDWRRH